MSRETERENYKELDLENLTIEEINDILSREEWALKGCDEMEDVTERLESILIYFPR